MKTAPEILAEIDRRLELLKTIPDNEWNLGQISGYKSLQNFLLSGEERENKCPTCGGNATFCQLGEIKVYGCAKCCPRESDRIVIAPHDSINKVK